MKILYEDGFLLVCEKPSDVLSEPGENSVFSFLKTETGRDYFPVHRLDRGTGGCFCVAKTPQAATMLGETIRSGLWQKEYLCVVSGIPEAPEGTWEDLLYHDARANKTYVVKKERRGVRQACLSYRILATAEENGKKTALVRVELHTGRTHQIRVQFASRKHPLLGDGKYGSRENRCRPALWCRRISFPHPFTETWVETVSEPPAGFPWSLF